MGDVTVLNEPAKKDLVTAALLTTEHFLRLLLSPGTDKLRAKEVTVLAEQIFGAALASELRRVNPALAEIEQAVWSIIERAMTAFFAPRLKELLTRLGL